MERVIKAKDLERARKRAARREKFRETVSNVGDWIETHRQEILVIVPIAITATISVVKVASRQRALDKQKDLKELYCYDRSLGHYWKLKRELSNREWIEIDTRKKSGERLSDILKDLKVLA